MVSDIRVRITLCVLGAALLCGASAQAEEPPSGTAAEAPGRPLRNLLERALSESAKDAGTSETAFRPRIELQYQHKDSRGPGVQDKGILRIDRPLLDDRVLFRVDVPYQQFDPQKHKETTGNGAGDLLIRTATRLMDRPIDGLIKVSSVPLRNALAHLGK